MHARTILTIASIAALTGTAVASTITLIRPDSATAASEFSSSYDIGNAIDGSGLPANFLPSDPHATYVQNNHWTTKANALPAGNARATFFFNEPKDLGRFYLWNHRSNGVASDPNYAVISFDLIFRDSDGAQLLALNELEAFGGVQTAQTYCFDEVQGVSSVELIILANQGSIYTGVAEVAFGDSSPSKCPGDSNFDGVIDLDDLNALLSNFGQPVGPCSPRDTNGDGVLNLDDLNYILTNFGSACPE